MSEINFFQEEVSFNLKHKRVLRAWLSSIIHSAGHQFNVLNFIYCSDNYLLKINKEYLDHDYYTDIITFDNTEGGQSPIDSDIFISIDRVKENARQLKLPYQQELHRVMIHGVLHLLGHQDKNEEQKQDMRKREEASLSLLRI